MSDAGDRPPNDHDAGEPTPAGEGAVPRALFTPGDPVPNLEMWVLDRKLGGGGFGEVWLARHERKGAAAVKFCTDPTARHDLVTHEKSVVARVMKHGGDHPNVVPLLECNLSGEIPWLMYEYVEGGTLAEAVEQWRELPPPRRLGRAVRVLRAVAGALATFHRFDPPLVHRDLKPQNILMAGGVPRITDFGIGGAATEAGRADTPPAGPVVRIPTIVDAFGSSQYAPQEQLFGSPPSPRDDVFALGVIAYQLALCDLTASPGHDAGAVLRAKWIPAELVSLVVRSVALDPEKRPKDATEWEKTLAAMVHKKTAVARAPAPPPKDAPSGDDTEVIGAAGAADAGGGVSQRLDVTARGRWYARPAGASSSWQIVAKTPTEVRVSHGEEYRFSIHSAATERDLEALGALAGLTSLCYLNLSYSAAITDEGLARLRAFTGLRQLFLRGCRNITDDGLPHLHALTDLLTLDLTECERVTPVGIAALRAALPKCKIQP